MNKFIGVAALLVLSAIGRASAMDTPPFLPPGTVDLAAILPPPPANDSAVTKAEIAEIHVSQTKATPAEQAQAKADTEEDVYIYANVLGPNLAADKLPVAAIFFDEVRKSEGEFVDPAKKVFGRPRPPLIDPTIVPCQKLSASGAYPSGHATTGYLFAAVLAQMVPEKRTEIFNRAQEYAHNRVLCGVHYPSDLEAGKLSGTAIAALLQGSPAYKAEFGSAKAELRKVLGMPVQ